MSDLEDYLISSSLSLVKVIHGNSSFIVPSTAEYSYLLFQPVKLLCSL